MAAESFSTPDLSDAAPGARALELQFVNYGASPRFSGQVVTIKCHEDNSLVKACVEEPGNGRVIVVDGGGSMRRSLLGDMLAEKAATQGWAGLVINGVVRDVDEIGRTALGVQALGSVPAATPDDVRVALHRARAAQRAWGRSSFRQRRAVLNHILEHVLDR